MKNTMNFLQKEKSDWRNFDYSNHLCILNLYPKDLVLDHGIQFFEYEEPGLGLQFGSVVEVSDIMYFLMAAVDTSNTLGRIKDDPFSADGSKEAVKILVKIKNTESKFHVAFSQLCNAFKLTNQDIYWINENLLDT